MRMTWFPALLFLIIGTAAGAATSDHFLTIDGVAGDESGEALYLDERVGRQLLHVTFGSVLTLGVDGEGRRFKDSILETLQQNPDLHLEFLERHFDRHLSGLNKG